MSPQGQDQLALPAFWGPIRQSETLLAHPVMYRAMAATMWQQHAKTVLSTTSLQGQGLLVLSVLQGYSVHWETLLVLTVMPLCHLLWLSHFLCDLCS